MIDLLRYGGRIERRIWVTASDALPSTRSTPPMFNSGFRWLRAASKAVRSRQKQVETSQRGPVARATVEAPRSPDDSAGNTSRPPVLGRKVVRIRLRAAPHGEAGQTFCGGILHGSGPVTSRPEAPPYTTGCRCCRRTGQPQPLWAAVVTNGSAETK